MVRIRFYGSSGTRTIGITVFTLFAVSNAAILSVGWIDPQQIIATRDLVISRCSISSLFSSHNNVLFGFDAQYNWGVFF